MKTIAIQNNIKPLLSPPINEKQSQEQQGNSFGKMLSNSITEVNSLQNEADKAIQELATGKGKGIHETMIALDKAEVSFKLMMQVRNKIIAAYEQIMRMQV